MASTYRASGTPRLLWVVFTRGCFRVFTLTLTRGATFPSVHRESISTCAIGSTFPRVHREHISTCTSGVHFHVCIRACTVAPRVSKGTSQKRPGGRLGKIEGQCHCGRSLSGIWCGAVSSCCSQQISCWHRNRIFRSRIQRERRIRPGICATTKLRFSSS